MRNRSPANSAASSPPVPARTSRMALFSSAASFGSSASRIVCSSSRARCAASARSSSASVAHLGVEGRLGQHGLDARRVRDSLVAVGRGSPPRDPRSRRVRATARRRSRRRGPPARRAEISSWRRRMRSSLSMGSMRSQITEGGQRRGSASVTPRYSGTPRRLGKGGASSARSEVDAVVRRQQVRRRRRVEHRRRRGRAASALTGPIEEGDMDRPR